ncbi:MAG: hypothetical protein KGR48_15440, partial [Alphaproteobacteria bacterium]|nr:hypothetical protein [Alphaproteobacteria bacterium]
MSSEYYTHHTAQWATKSRLPLIGRYLDCATHWTLTALASLQRSAVGDDDAVAEDEVVPEFWGGALDQVLASFFFA